MKRLVVVVCLVLAGMGGLGVTGQGVTQAASNSDAAHACQQGGYLTLQGSDGTTFQNAGQCVSYAAHGGTIVGLNACTVVSGSNGCITLNGLTITYGSSPSYGTISLTGVFSFSPVTTCGAYYSAPACGPTAGGGTYSVSGGTFNGGTSGTFTIAGTTFATNFFDATNAPVTCSQAVASGQWAVLVPVTFTDSVTGQQLTTYVTGVGSGPEFTEAAVLDPNNPSVTNAPYNQFYTSGLPGVTISC